MELRVNGEARAVEDGANLSGLLKSLGLDASRVAVEHNGELVARERFDELALSPGDRLEIVHFVGGG